MGVYCKGTDYGGMRLGSTMSRRRKPILIVGQEVIEGRPGAQALGPERLDLAASSVLSDQTPDWSLPCP